MSSLQCVLLFAFASVVAARIAPAQVDTAHSVRSELSLAVGVAHTDRLDATASPIRFGGQGVDLAAHYRRARGAMVVTASIDGGTRNLAPRASSGSAGEQLTSGSAHVAALHRLGGTPTGFAIGVDANASIDVTAHRYADANASISDFLIGTFSLGPALWWDHRIAGGIAHAEVSAPLVGLVDHPYSDIRVARISVRPVTAQNLHGFTGAIIYAPAAHRRVGIEYAYRFRVFGYSDVQPVRSASHALSVGVVTRFGAR
ncbi:MAG: hypothetical protein ABJF01_20700 [bacterium]